MSRKFSGEVDISAFYKNAYSIRIPDLFLFSCLPDSFSS